MKVKELIRMLQCLDPELVVSLPYPDGYRPKDLLEVHVVKTVRIVVCDDDSQEAPDFVETRSKHGVPIVVVS